MEVKGLIARNWGFLLLLALTAALSPAMTEILPRKDIATPAKIVLVISYLVLAAQATIGEFRHQRFERKLESRLSSLTERGLLLRDVSKRTAVLLSEIRTELGRIRDESGGGITGARERCIKFALSETCSLLEGDRRGAGDEELLVTFFKATLFEYNAAIGREGGLRRMYWRYPPTKRPQTEQIDFNACPNAGATRCFRGRKMIIMGSVEDAAKDGQVWMDTRPGQLNDYRGCSMICVPIWAERGAPAEVRGVVTIDTNRTGYFKDNPNDVEFLNQLLEPFLDAIRLVYNLTEPNQMTPVVASPSAPAVAGQ